ncbi:uncharacterized protein LOC129226163 [Uloborus diversus]|uniref:uncharacterized protein LOC129226163 n=1 Tax=Uloborus diversus TaxID=327109 RepID=UPI002409FA98|nr:uncharacterized protein LOC129226163 [Uloborus diversus]
MGKNLSSLVKSDIDDIVTKEEYRSLGDLAAKLTNATPEDIARWKAEKVYCKYVLSHLEDGIDDSRKAKFLAYYNLMSTFINYPYTEFRKKSAAVEIPEPFQRRLLDDFTVTSTTTMGRNQRSFPPKMKDKLLSHMIVLALFIDDFCSDSGLIHADVKFGLVHLLSVAQLLGCYVRKKTTPSVVKLIELRVPLNVFNPKVFRKKNF